MNIVEPYADLVRIDGQAAIPASGLIALRWIELCGRISHRSEDAQTNESWRRFIETVVMGHGDWSIIEHSTASVDMLVDRGITHELVRHRLFSFTQQSTRFINHEKKMPPSFINPLTGDDCIGAHQAWSNIIRDAEEGYRALIKWGCSPKIARSVFPNALASRIMVTGNLRNWRHLFLMRTTKETHPQFRQVSIPLLAQFKACIPLLFDDIEPMARQIDNMRKPK